MVDSEQAFSSSQAQVNDDTQWRPVVEPLIGALPADEPESDLCHYECCKDDYVYEDKYVEQQRNDDYLRSLIPDDRTKEPSIAIYPRTLQRVRSPENTVTDDELVIMSYRVFGFVLRSRKWGKSPLSYWLEYLLLSWRSPMVVSTFMGRSPGGGLPPNTP
jgi:hypothetical protein